MPYGFYSVGGTNHRTFSQSRQNKNNMNNIKIALTLLTFTSVLCAQNNIETAGSSFNQHNQVVKDQNGSYNYSKSEMDAFLNFEERDFNHSNKSQNSTSGTDCEILWQDVIFGTCIGANNNLIPFDYGNDGTIELLASASQYGFGNGGYWYILKYNNANASYEKVYVSRLYEEPIGKLTVVDLHDDGQLELLLGMENLVEIINLEDMSIIHAMTINQTTGIYGIKQLRYDDADNDGEKEIVVAGYNGLVLINHNNWEIEADFQIEAGDFDIGNVDGDAALETVFAHGLTLEISTQGNYTEEYDFRLDVGLASGLIELSDIDADGKLEAIVANSWYSIVVYDIDITSPKYEIESDLDIDALTVFDMNHDGIDEIFYGDGQWGEIYAHNGSNGNLLWHINNPEHGTTGIAIADFDSDGTSEIVWGAGCSSSGSDYLFFHSISNLQREWQTIHIDGPYYAIEVADVDEDGRQEIVTISYESESGYDAGILTVYDAETKAIEFRSASDFFSFIWTGVYNLEIGDYNNDGDTDIFIAAGDTYDGKFWIVDGNTFSIEAQHGYPWEDDISEFYALELADVDDDNDIEIIAVNADKLYIVNDQDFSIAWSSVSLGGGYLPQGVLVGNLDDDTNKEIVVCKDYIYTFDGINHTQSQSLLYNYSAIQLHDWDEDGKMEILAGTSDGLLQVLDGATLEILESFSLSSQRIGGIGVFDLNGDDIADIIATAGDQVVFLTKSGNIIQGQSMIRDLGQYDAIEVVDYDQNGIPNILLGTALGIMELNPSCAQCLWFEFQLVGEDASCGEDNGAIHVIDADTSTTFYFQGDDTHFTDSRVNLTDGIYLISAMNSVGCSADTTIIIENLELEASLTVQHKTCFGDDDGWAAIDIYQAGYPVNIQWSNGVTEDTLSGLNTGVYSVLVVDNNGCAFLDTFTVEQSVLETTLSVDKPACVNTNNGAASILINQGAGGYSYAWDSMQGGSYSFGLGSGNHVVAVTDANGCTSIHNFFIDSTDLQIETQQLSASCNGASDGSASVSILEGTAPYFYSWSSTGLNSNLINNIMPGIYRVTVYDGNQCTAVDSVVIQESVLSLQTAATDLDCHDDSDGSAVVFVTEGVAPYSYQWQDGSTTSSISNLSAGTYFVLVQDSIGCIETASVEVTSPPPLNVSLTIVADNELTTELEGAIEANVSGGTPPYFYNWDNGATISSIDEVMNGFYNLLITDFKECKLDTLIELNATTSIDDINAHQSLYIYPNPNAGEFTIENIDFSNVIYCQLFSSEGKLVMSNFMVNRQNENAYHFNLPNLSNGYYYLLITSNDDVYHAKIAVVH